MGDRGQAAACAAAYRACPALRGVTPSVQVKGGQRVFVFSAVVSGGAGGRAIRQVVRVSVDAVGEVVRVAVSR